MPATAVPKSKDFMEWYNEVVEVAELTDKRYPIKGMNIWRPYGQRIMSRIDSYTRSEMERTHHDEVSFPLLIPEKLFMKEADQIKGFGSEVFWVTHAGDNKLPDNERWVVRPTSECAMYEIFPLWIRSHSDLPLTTYQICNVFRYETKQTRAFMRVREIHFFEDHSVFADEASARAHVELDLQIVKNVYDRLALPALYSKRPDWDKFPGAVDSTGADVVMPSGRTLQCATVHYYGENFAKAYGMGYEPTTSWSQDLANLNPWAQGKFKVGGRQISVIAQEKIGGAGRRDLTAHEQLDIDDYVPENVPVQYCCTLDVDAGDHKLRLVSCEAPSHNHESNERPAVDVRRHLPNLVFGTPLEATAYDGRLARQHRFKLASGQELVLIDYYSRVWCHQTTYGMSERLVGAVVGCHGDDNGLILPPDIAPFQVVIVPVIFKDGGEAVLAACKQVADRLRAAGLRVELDERPKTSGEKYYHWELRGVPLRLEIGPKDVEKKSVFAARRDMGKEGKKAIPMDNLEAGVKEVLTSIQKVLFDKQAAFVATRVKHPKTLDEAKALDAEAAKTPVGYVFAMPICSDSCAATVEKGLDIKTLGVPAGVDKAQNVGGTCAVCGKHAKDTLRFARTY